ncbi:MAG: ATP-binding protein [Kiritimatiellae bacterium]|nr:ATP-binding protein [Kiritimatiellia bacterium]
MDLGLLTNFMQMLDDPAIAVDDRLCLLTGNRIACQMLLKDNFIPRSSLRDSLKLDPDAGRRLSDHLAALLRRRGDGPFELTLERGIIFPEPVRITAQTFNIHPRPVSLIIMRTEGARSAPHEELLAGSSIAMIEMSPDQKIVFGGERLAEALHQSCSEVMNAPLSSLVSASVRPLFLAAWTRVMRGEVVNGYEFKLRCGDGHYESFWITLHPVKDHEGNIRSVHGLVGDMRVQKGLAYALEAAEERFSVLFRESSDPILILSLTGDIMLVNPAFENMAGISAESLFSGKKGWPDFIHEAELPQVMAAIWECSREQKDRTVECRITGGKASGWVEQTFSIIHDENGAARGMLAVGRNITARKEHEIQLQARAELMTQRHGHAQDVLTHLNHFLTVISDLPEEKGAFLRGVCGILYDIFTPLHLDIWLPETKDFVYRSKDGFSSPLTKGRSRTRVALAFEEQVLQGKPVYCNHMDSAAPFCDDPVIRATGLRTYLGVPLRDSSGGLHGLLRLVDSEARDFQPIDVEMFTLAGLQVADWLKSERHGHITAELEAHLRQAQKMEAIGMLAGGIAHDFNNILSSILGFSSFLLSKVEPESQLYRPLSLIEKSAIHAADLTRQLLAFSQKKNLEQIPVSLNNVIRGVTGILEHSLRKTICVETVLDKDIPMVMGDQGQLNQIIMNLCINASEAMEENGGTLRIESRFRPLTPREKGVLLDVPGNLVCVSVSDTGRGMSEEVVEHIFDPFYTTKSGSGGTGLGLSIVYGLVAKHGGDIRVESQKNKGSCFTVYLPPCRTAEIQPGTSEEPPRSGGNETLLVIDDDEIILEMVASVLSSGGYRVLTASSGEAGVELLRKNRGAVDLVLLDMIMPDMDGEITFNALREIEPGLAVLLTSGLARAEHCAKLIQRGAKGMISKPYTSARLLKDIQRVLG